MGQLDIKAIMLEAGEEFCERFMKEPYLCYTEHGQHALFFSHVYEKLKEKEALCATLDLECEGEGPQSIEICVLQKEYPTAGLLEAGTRRQHWDISVLKSDKHRKLESKCKENPVDFIELDAVAEFGLNASKAHLLQDVKRLVNDQSQVNHKFVFHLFRLSPHSERPSRRDRAPSTSYFLTCDEAESVVRNALEEKKAKNETITMFWAVHDRSDRHENDWECRDVAVTP